MPRAEVSAFAVCASAALHLSQSHACPSCVPHHRRRDPLAQSIKTRIRTEVPYRLRTQTMRVMFKPLAGGTIDEYLALVERDRPEA